MLWRLFQAIHGHFGILAAAALLHPAILLRKGLPLSRGMRWALGLTTAFVVVAFTSGLLIYGEYRAVVKRPLFVVSPRAGLLFETKEHLAVAVIGLTMGGAVAALVAPPRGRELRQTAAVLFALAAVLCLVTSALGSWVTAIRGF